MSNFWLVYKFYFNKLIRGKAWIWFALLGMVPSVIIFLNLMFSRSVGWGSGSKAIVFLEITVNYFFKFFILVVPLYFSTSVLSEEIEQKTIVFSYSLPIKRGSFIFFKFISYLSVSLIIVTGGLLLALLMANQHQLGLFSVYKSIAMICLSSIWGTIAYSSFSFLLGTVLKRPMLVGLIFVFPWEQFVQLMPGFIQKLSIFYFVRSTLPVSLPEKANFLRMFQQTSSVTTALVVLLVLSVLFCITALYRSGKREYVLE